MGKVDTKTLVKFVAFVLLIGTAVWYFRSTGITPADLAQTVLTKIKSFAPYDRVVYVVVYVVGTVILLPGTALSFAGAVLFGVWQGTLFTWIGAVIGASLAFPIAKWMGRGFVDQLLGGRLEAFDRRVRENGFQGLLIIRLLPIFPFNGVNFGSGLTSIGFRDYILATAIGILPGTFVYQYLFATVGEPLLTEGPKWEYFKDPSILGALGLFVVFLVVMKLLTGKFQKPASVVADDQPASVADSSE